MNSPARQVVASLALAGLAVAGCAGKEVVYQPFEVKVPVEVPCAAQLPAEPQWATRDMPQVDPVTGVGIDVAVDKMASELHQRKAFEEKQRAAVRGCQ